MSRSDLIQKIVPHYFRVFGPDSIEGTNEEYAWLKEYYGITEEDDVFWQTICEYERDDLGEHYEPDELAQLLERLRDDNEVLPFLQTLLQRFSANDARYPRR